MARWDQYDQLVSLLGTLTLLARDDGQANPADEVRRVTLAKLAELLIDEGSITSEIDTAVNALGGEKYIISPSVASNNLTVALKYIDGTDPSSTKSLKFRVGNTEYTLTAAMSFAKNAGTNWCNAGSAEMAANDIDFFMYAIGETGGSAGLKFGYSRIPYATTMADFVNTTTSEKYIAGNWTNFNSTDTVRLIGRFRAQLSLSGSGHLWSIPSAKVLNYPIDETGMLTWTPAFSASGSMTYTSVSNTYSRYIIQGRNLSAWIRNAGTTGGTASNNLIATLPFNSLLSATASVGCAGFCVDTAAIAAFAVVNSGTPDSVACRKYDFSNYGLGASRAMGLEVFYEI